ncbi:MAG: hypothetical protein IPL54_07565 [Chitinophagaceae bacterium]|nr:hypothetical protein [Chitinophagaceae bacterium]
MNKQNQFSKELELLKMVDEYEVILQDSSQKMKEDRDPEEIVWTYGDFTVNYAGKKICNFIGLKIILKSTDDVAFQLQFESLIIKGIPNEPFTFTIKIFDHVVGNPPGAPVAEFKVNVPNFICKQKVPVDNSRNISGIFNQAVMAKISFFISGYEC